MNLFGGVTERLGWALPSLASFQAVRAGADKMFTACLATSGLPRRSHSRLRYQETHRSGCRKGLEEDGCRAPYSLALLRAPARFCGVIRGGPWDGVLGLSNVRVFGWSERRHVHPAN